MPLASLVLKTIIDPIISEYKNQSFDIFSGNASVYAHWKKKLMLLYCPDRNLPDAYLAHVLHRILAGDAHWEVEIHFTADWNGDNYHKCGNILI